MLAVSHSDWGLWQKGLKANAAVYGVSRLGQFSEGDLGKVFVEDGGVKSLLISEKPQSVEPVQQVAYEYHGKHDSSSD
jgi:hypothetical protein